MDPTNLFQLTQILFLCVILIVVIVLKKDKPEDERRANQKVITFYGHRLDIIKAFNDWQKENKVHIIYSHWIYVDRNKETQSLNFIYIIEYQQLNP